MVLLALLHIKCSEKNSSSHDAGEWRVTKKMCRRIGRSTFHLNKFFSINGISRNCCWIKPGKKNQVLKFCRSSSIAGLHYFSCQCHLFRKEVNNVHPECECTCWRYSKKNKQTIKRKKYSKTNNEREHRDCSFWISSIAPLGWIFEIR